MLLQRFQHAGFVELGHDGAFDVEGGGRLVAVVPLLDLGGGGRVGLDIHFDVLQAARLEPGARPAAARAPAGAVHDDAAVGQRLGFGRRAFQLGQALGGQRVDPAQHVEQHIVVRLVVDVVHVDVADDAPFIQHEKRPFGMAVIFAEDIVAFGHQAVRPEVAQQRVRDAAHRFGPCLEGINMINADTQNLGIQSRELGLSAFVRRDLRRSYGGERQRVERQDYVFTSEFGECIFAAQV